MKPKQWSKVLEMAHQIARGPDTASMLDAIRRLTVPEDEGAIDKALEESAKAAREREIEELKERLATMEKLR